MQSCSYAPSSVAWESQSESSIQVQSTPMWNQPPIFQSFQDHLGEIADVSLTLETLPFCKYLSLLDNLRDRTQEADGSIPFISTKVIRRCDLQSLDD